MSGIRSRVIQAIIVLAAAVAVGAGCHSEPSSLGVSLTAFSSGERARVDALANPTLKLYIEMSDLRQDVSKIGENREEDRPRLIYSSGSTPAEFIRDLVSREFAGSGMTVVNDRAHANRLLKLSVTQFFVMETGMYRAQVGVTAEVTDSSGKSLWVKNILGENDTWGKSYRARNYQQVLTAATVEVAGKMVKDADFMQAMKVP